MWFKPFSNGWFAATWLIDWLTWRRSWRRIVSVANATRRTLYAMKRHQSQHGKLYGCVVWTQQQGYLTWEVPLSSRLNGLGSINRGTLVVPQEIKKVIQNCVLREICVQRDRQTDTLIAVRRFPTAGVVIINELRLAHKFALTYFDGCGD